MPHEYVSTQDLSLSRHFVGLTAAAVLLTSFAGAEMATQAVGSACDSNVIATEKAGICDVNDRVRGVLPGILDIAVPDVNPRPLFESKGIS